VGLSDLFANNLFVKLIRGDTSRNDLIVSMVGTRLGDRLLVVGGGDGPLVAALGRPTGLTGRICAVEPDAARADRVRETATAAGVLLEVESAPLNALPYDANAFDVVVVPATSDFASAVTDVRRILRTGGRCVVVVAAAGTGDAPSPIDRLQRAGFRVSRLIAERLGLSFYEAIKLAD
jgi:ubiquinone/menaquinone biosynthesis C-methylase UbiE